MKQIRRNPSYLYFLGDDLAHPSSPTWKSGSQNDNGLLYCHPRVKGQCGAVVHKLATTRAVTSSNPAHLSPPSRRSGCLLCPHRTHSTGSEVSTHVCEYRTWQSTKQRYLKHIETDLNSGNNRFPFLSPEDLKLLQREFVYPYLH
ncbi:Uncharacterized protein FWK35_00018949 [Aphis craccivora]|uniref:Uncharacterized protein n=1 Tax=Aphis craccivora TaxID=307492 RepID=A0A6G0Y056_APHCR|nr:Uncharacterized protein FWK35_00018949 [Aphis craccivora]